MNELLFKYGEWWGIWDHLEAEWTNGCFDTPRLLSTKKAADEYFKAVGYDVGRYEVILWEPVHDWEQTGWEYDDSFFTCTKCGLKTHQKKQYPPDTAKACREAGLEVCKPKTL